MNKLEVSNIIEATLKQGSKIPGLFELPRIMAVKRKLESCSDVSEVVGVLEKERSLICKSFGLGASVFDAGIEKDQKTGRVISSGVRG
jgi:hypothetical protein